ncbi:MAG TPA: DinB family protein [Bacteroidia bacterium]|jgi:uncharacterized damage-inducible protein DinB|nr:DinB family protein [Bacteroidia bacterium]
MNINQPLLMEFKHEAAKTRKMLERVPFEQATWKPHDKSTALGALATHIARVPTWIERVLTREEFDMLAPNAFPKVELHKNTQELLAYFDANNAIALKQLEGASDEALMKPWTFRRGEQVIFTLPRGAVIREMALNHQYHHRGQMSVYLRQLNVPVPGMFGPSADEQ